MSTTIGLVLVVIVIVLIAIALSRGAGRKAKAVPPSVPAPKQPLDRASQPGKYGTYTTPSKRFPSGGRTSSDQSSAKPIAGKSSNAAKKPNEEKSDPILEQLKKSKGAWGASGYRETPPPNKKPDGK